MSLVVPFAEIFEHKRGVLTSHHSWERTELGMVCEVLNGFPFKSVLFNKSKGFPVIRIRDLIKGKTETFFNGKFPSEYVIDNGDLLIGMDGIFRCVEWRGGKAGLNQRVCKIIPNEKYLVRKFLLAGLNGYLKAIEDATSSVTVGHLSSRDILRIPFPVPPLAEQRRIVARLEALLGKVDDCRKRLDKVPVLLKRFRQSILAAACSGRLSANWKDDETGWVKVSVGEIISTASNGLSKRHGDEGEEQTVLRLADFSGNHRVFGKERKIRLTDHEREKYTLNNDDLLVIRVNGSREIAGRFILYKGQKEAYCDHFIRVKVDSQQVNAAYIVYAMNTPAARQGIENSLVTSAGQNTINQQALSALPLQLPSLEEQNEIVRRVEALFAVADQIETRSAKGKAYVDKLTQSILAKAFRGELVPQDENDEPASVLLDRIRMQRASVVAAAPPTPKPRTGVATPATRGPSTVPARRGRPPKAAPPTPAPLGSTGMRFNSPFTRTALAILKRMKPEHDYARADLADALGLSMAEWNSSINELKHAGSVMQKGERRGARYRKTVEPGASP